MYKTLLIILVLSTSTAFAQAPSLPKLRLKNTQKETVFEEKQQNKYEPLKLPKKRDLILKSEKGIFDNVFGKHLVKKATPIKKKSKTKVKYTPPKKLPCGGREDKLLFVVIEEGNINGVHALLDKRVNVECKNSVGDTALIFATKMGDFALVQLFISRGANVNATDNKKQTAIYSTAFMNDFEIADLLIKNKSKLNVKDKFGATPLMIATKDGRIGIMETFLNSGANPKSTMYNGKTALHIAAEVGRPDAIYMLINSRVNINAKDKKGMTALMYAVQSGDITSIALLLDNGVEIDSIYNNRGESAVDIAMNNPNILNMLLSEQVRRDLYQ